MTEKFQHLCRQQIRHLYKLSAGVTPHEKNHLSFLSVDEKKMKLIRYTRNSLEFGKQLAMECQSKSLQTKKKRDDLFYILPFRENLT